MFNRPPTHGNPDSPATNRSNCRRQLAREDAQSDFEQWLRGSQPRGGNLVRGEY
jgi:hypothetical protein